MSFIDSNTEDKITESQSEEALNSALSDFIPTSAQDLVDEADTSGEDISANTLIAASTPKKILIRTPSILTKLKERTTQFFQPTQKKRSLLSSRKVKNPYQKYKYYRNQQGRIIRREINPLWAKFEGINPKSLDNYGRIRGGVTASQEFEH